MVASLTLFLQWWDEKPFQDVEGSRWRFILPVILVFLSAMMVSEVKYPTFKRLDWRTQRPFVKTLLIVLVVGFLVLLWQKVLPVAAPLGFTAYLLYGFIRPSISRQMQREIEVDDEPDDEPEPGSPPPAGSGNP
jgi:CDP-diacylglycerol--serine O-phosphatidyltransferase